MKKLFFVVFVFYKICSFAGSGDTIHFNKQFPEIKFVVLKDTLMDIHGTSLDTFSTKPRIVIVIRDYEGFLLTGNVQEILIQDIANPSKGYYEHVYGINSRINIESKNEFFESGHQYQITLLNSESSGKADVVFKTLLSSDFDINKTYVYEVRLGMQAKYADCIIDLPKKVNKKHKPEIVAFLSSKPLRYFGSERAHIIMSKDLITLLKLEDKMASALSCHCEVYSR